MTRKIGCLICGLLLSPTLYAFNIHDTWTTLWHTPDQQGMQLMQQQQYQAAANHFQHPAWRAAANYRAGQYQTAAQLYKAQQDFYNYGNSLAQLGQYQAALEAYQQVLKQIPNQADALANKQLMEELLKQQPPQSSNQSQQPQPSSANDNNKSNPSTPENNNSNASPPPPQPQPQQSSTPEQPPPQPPEKMPEDSKADAQKQEQKDANDKWLKLVPDHPGGLLRQQFLRDHLKRMQGDQR